MRPLYFGRHVIRHAENTEVLGSEGNVSNTSLLGRATASLAGRCHFYARTWSFGEMLMCGSPRYLAGGS